jgi:hypothetical protein
MLLRKSASIVVIGNGSWKFIKAYQKLLSCPYAIYTQPSRSIYRRFGMVVNSKRTPAGESKASYVRDSLAGSVIRGAWYRCCSVRRPTEVQQFATL